MQLTTEQIAKADNPLACGYYALINLYRLRQVESPTFARLVTAFLTDIKNDALFARRSSNITAYGLTLFDQLRLLIRFEFPALCAVGAIHSQMSARELFPSFLEAGCALIANYTWQRQDGRLIGHSVVLDGCTPEGFTAIDSTAGFDDGSLIDLEPQFTSEQIKEIEEKRAASPHGTRRILPFARTATPSDPVGIHTYFLIAYPGSL